MEIGAVRSRAILWFEKGFGQKKLLLTNKKISFFKQITIPLHRRESQPVFN